MAIDPFARRQLGKLVRLEGGGNQAGCSLRRDGAYGCATRGQGRVGQVGLPILPDRRCNANTRRRNGVSSDQRWLDPERIGHSRQMIQGRIANPIGWAAKPMLPAFQAGRFLVLGGFRRPGKPGGKTLITGR